VASVAQSAPVPATAVLLSTHGPTVGAAEGNAASAEEQYEIVEMSVAKASSLEKCGMVLKRLRGSELPRIVVRMVASTIKPIKMTRDLKQANNRSS
jgi:hypothetical protein